MDIGMKPTLSYGKTAPAVTDATVLAQRLAGFYVNRNEAQELADAFKATAKALDAVTSFTTTFELLILEATVDILVAAAEAADVLIVTPEGERWYPVFRDEE